MTFLNGMRAILELGLPVAALSWLLFYRLYSRGDLDRAADHKTIRTSLKVIKKAHKKSAGSNILHAKWMKFGGGFYGVTALWTLIVMEVSGIVTTLLHPSSLDGMFKDGLIGFVVEMLVNQFTTFVGAFMWFTYWPDEDGGFLLWIAIAYAGYMVGLNVARQEIPAATNLMQLDWRSRLRTAFRTHHDQD